MHDVDYQPTHYHGLRQYYVRCRLPLPFYHYRFRLPLSLPRFAMDDPSRPPTVAERGHHYDYQNVCNGNSQWEIRLHPTHVHGSRAHVTSCKRCMAMSLSTVVIFIIICSPWHISIVVATRVHDNLVRRYFEEGFSYNSILCFLLAYHGVCISLSTLKRIFRRLQLRRRGDYSSLQYVGRCLLVS